jgi:hypothetical protein
MPEQPEPDYLSSAPASPVEPLQITTPVIDIQDLEHQASPETRVSNKGVRIEPKLEPRIEPRMDSFDERDHGQEIEEALLALERIEKSLRGELPG